MCEITELWYKTKEDMEIFKEFFSEFLNKYKGPGCIKMRLLSLIPLFLSIFFLIISFSGIEENKIHLFSENFDKIIYLILFIYTTVLFLLMTATIFSAGNGKILNILLKFLFIVVLLVNFIQVNYNPMENDKLFVFGVMVTMLNLILIFFICLFIFINNLLDVGTNAGSIFLLILIPKFISDCITCMITEIYIESLNDGYNNKHKEISKKNYKKFSRRYLKNLRLRAQLLILILMFFSVVIFPTKDKELNSNFINVVSGISLAMMFMDKRKEWSFDNIKE